MTHNTREGIEEIVYNLPTSNDGDIVLTISEMFNLLHQELQKAREEAIAREKQLKQVHMMELDAISCMSLEQYVVWRDHRKQRPNQSELDQPTV